MSYAYNIKYLQYIVSVNKYETTAYHFHTFMEWGWPLSFSSRCTTYGFISYLAKCVIKQHKQCVFITFLYLTSDIKRKISNLHAFYTKYTPKTKTIWHFFPFNNKLWSTMQLDINCFSIMPIAPIKFILKYPRKHSGELDFDRVAKITFNTYISISNQ